MSSQVGSVLVVLLALAFFGTLLPGSFGLPLAERENVVLYRGHFTGQSWNLFVPQVRSECVPLPNDALSRVTSVEPNGHCVILFRNGNCSGRGVRIEDYSYGYDDLGRVGFNDAASSLRRC